MVAAFLIAVALNVVSGNNMPLVEATVEGVPCTLLVDTGASHTTLDLGFVTNSLPKVELQTVELMGTTNVRTLPKFVAVTNFTIGTESFAVEGMMAIDLKHLSQGVGRKVDGILGMNHLRMKPCVISLGRGELVFNPDEAELTGFHEVMTRDRGTTFELVVKLPNGKIVPMLIDTGSSFTFLNRELWEAGEKEIRMGTSDVNANEARAFTKGAKGELNCGRGFKLAVEPILTEETNRNQLGSDVFREHDIYLDARGLRLR